VVWIGPVDGVVSVCPFHLIRQSGEFCMGRGQHERINRALRKDELSLRDVLHVYPDDGSLCKSKEDESKFDCNATADTVGSYTCPPG